MISNNKTQDLPRISEIRETLRKCGNLREIKICGARVKYLSGNYRRLVYICPPIFPKKFHTNCGQIQRRKNFKKKLRKSQKKKNFRFGEEIKWSSKSIFGLAQDVRLQATPSRSQSLDGKNPLESMFCFAKFLMTAHGPTGPYRDMYIQDGCDH
jgi:hypothetical protein